MAESINTAFCLVLRPKSLLAFLRQHRILQKRNVLNRTNVITFDPLTLFFFGCISETCWCPNQTKVPLWGVMLLVWWELQCMDRNPGWPQCLWWGKKEPLCPQMEGKGPGQGLPSDLPSLVVQRDVVGCNVLLLSALYPGCQQAFWPCSLAPGAHTSHPSLLFPCFDLFWCLSEKPGRAEACFQPCRPARPCHYYNVPYRERGGSGDRENTARWVDSDVFTLFFQPASLCYLIISPLFPISLCLFPFLNHIIPIKIILNHADLKSKAHVLIKQGRVGQFCGII